ncbi:PBSX family phage terminase large subunit [bacterium]|nr:PBSX family phage terminase large subunit [bacterium]
MDKVKINIPEKSLFLLTEKSRYKVLVGGRGSAKSYSVGLTLLIKGMQTKIRILCTRQIQASIKDSVHKLLSDLINEYNLNGFYSVTQDTIRGINGTEFIFKGLKNNIGEIKSTQGINIAWCEEAESITQESWDVLIPTIREPESEIWITFNPNLKTDATYQNFVVNKPDNCITVQMNYTDNPFFPDVLRDEMEFCKKINYPKYEHIWLGVPNAEAGNLIKMNMFQRYKLPPERFNGLYICCDTAFSEKKSADNSAFMLMGVKGKDKYILDVYCKKVTFVDLCRDLKNFYLSAVEKYGKTNSLSAIYIENKASGISLTQQLRAEGLPIMEIYPTVHNEQLKKDIVADKYTRFLEIEADLCSGYVWIPESASWMPEFEQQCEAFTGGKQDEHDDICDTLIYALKISKKYGQTDWKAFGQVFRR